MNVDKFIKGKDHKHTCPICNVELSVIPGDHFTKSGMVGYECSQCFVPDVRTKSGKPFSRYNIGVVENLRVDEDKVLEQVVSEETFYVHFKRGQWFQVHNNLRKGQTMMVLTRPMELADKVYDDEPIGVVWIKDIVHLPFIDSWNLADEEGTVSKIKTYLLFL